MSFPTARVEFEVALIDVGAARAVVTMKAVSAVGRCMTGSCLKVNLLDNVESRCGVLEYDLLNQFCKWTTG